MSWLIVPCHVEIGRLTRVALNSVLLLVINDKPIALRFRITLNFIYLFIYLFFILLFFFFFFDDRGKPEYLEKI